MNSEIFVYILNIHTAHGLVVQLISADLYDFMQEKIGECDAYEIPKELIDLNKKIPQAKPIEKSVVLSEDSPQIDTWKHILGTSRDFKSTSEAYKSMERTCEYAGEVDIYLNQ